MTASATIEARIFATTKKVWALIDGTDPTINGRKIFINPGRYELERITNPRRLRGSWLVLHGTLIGMSEVAWRQWRNGQLATDPQSVHYGKPIDWGEDEIQIEDPIFEELLAVCWYALERHCKGLDPEEMLIYIARDIELLRACFEAKGITSIESAQQVTVSHLVSAGLPSLLAMVSCRAIRNYSAIKS